MSGSEFEEELRASLKRIESLLENLLEEAKASRGGGEINFSQLESLGDLLSKELVSDDANNSNDRTEPVQIIHHIARMPVPTFDLHSASRGMLTHLRQAPTPDELHKRLTLFKFIHYTTPELELIHDLTKGLKFVPPSNQATVDLGHAFLVVEPQGSAGRFQFIFPRDGSVWPEVAGSVPGLDRNAGFGDFWVLELDPDTEELTYLFKEHICPTEAI